MNITASEINSLIGAIGGTIGAIGGIVGIWFSWKTNREIENPKIKFNLNKIKGGEHSTAYDLFLENISTRNLYDFSIRLQEIDQIDEPLVKEESNLFHVIIPVFTIGQVYSTFLFDATKCKDKLNELNFIIKYRMKKNGKENTEKYTINIHAFRNITRERKHITYVQTFNENN